MKKRIKKTFAFMLAVMIMISMIRVPMQVNAANGSWLSDDNGWWYEENGWFPVYQWLVIDETWYFFDENGYMAAEEWRAGCWLDSDGAWRYGGTGVWKSDDNGWWFEDSLGWWPSNEWQKIDGNWYHFDASGYMEHDKYVDGCWLDSSGVWAEEPEEEEPEKKEEPEVRRSHAEVKKFNLAERWAEIELTNGSIYRAENLNFDDAVKKKYYGSLTDDQVIQAEAFVEYLVCELKKEEAADELEMLKNVTLYVTLLAVFSENDEAKSNDPMASTPYGLLVGGAYNMDSILQTTGRMLDYLGYSNWKYVTDDEGKKQIDIEKDGKTIRLDIYKGTATYMN